MKHWKQNTKKSMSHFLELEGTDEGVDGEKACVKWDGRIHLYLDANTYLHICSIDEMIEKLQEIKARAIPYFKSTLDIDWNS